MLTSFPVQTKVKEPCLLETTKFWNPIQSGFACNFPDSSATLVNTSPGWQTLSVTSGLSGTNSTAISKNQKYAGRWSQSRGRAVAPEPLKQAEEAIS